MKEGEYENAIECYDECIDGEEKINLHAMIAKAKFMYKINGDINTAIEILKKVIAKDLGISSGRLELGRLYIDIQQYKLAEEQYGEIIKVNNDHLVAHLELGRLYVIEGNLESARNCFLKCMKLDNNNLCIKSYIIYDQL